MPYVSERQRRYMHAKLPGLAARWDKKYGGKIKRRKKELIEFAIAFKFNKSHDKLGRFSKGRGGSKKSRPHKASPKMSSETKRMMLEAGLRLGVAAAPHIARGIGLGGRALWNSEVGDVIRGGGTQGGFRYNVNRGATVASWFGKERRDLMFTTKQESLDQKASKIRKAIYDELRPPPQPVSDTYGYVRDVYEDHVIYCEGEHDWKVPFTVDAEGNIEAAPRDEWTEVEQTWTEVKSLRDFVVRLKAKGKRGAKAPLGQGGRFAALEAKIAARGKVSNPAAVAAAIGRNKYGAGRMAKLSAQGRKHKEMTATFKFNRAHDALGRFAKKVGGAISRQAKFAGSPMGRAARAEVGHGRLAGIALTGAALGAATGNVPLAVGAGALGAYHVRRSFQAHAKLRTLAGRGPKRKKPAKGLRGFVTRGVQRYPPVAAARWVMGKNVSGLNVTLKFNRLHDKLGKFAKKVGGALKPSAAHQARKKAGIAAIKKGVAGASGAIKKAGRWFLLGPSDKRGVPKLAMGRAILGGARAVGRGKTAVKRGIVRSVRAVGKVRRGVKRGIGKAASQVGRVSEHEGPLGKPIKKILGRVVTHVGPGVHVRGPVRRGIRAGLRRVAKTGRAGKFMAGGGLVGAALRRRRRKEFQMPMTSFVFKGADDSYRWVLLSSNGFRDKDGEIISTKALQQDVAQWELAGSPAQPLRFWHVPLTEDYSRGLEIGTCDFRMVNGHTLIESGTFLTKEIGEAVYGAQDKLAASLGFRHSPFEPDSDKIFNTIRTFERSLLPKESASNALTYLAAFTPQGV